MEVYVKVSYGIPKVYASCEEAKKFLNLLGKKSFSRDQLMAVGAIGIQLKQVPCPDLEMSLDEAIQLMAEKNDKKAKKSKIKNGRYYVNEKEFPLSDLIVTNAREAASKKYWERPYAEVIKDSHTKWGFNLEELLKENMNIPVEEYASILMTEELKVSTNFLKDLKNK